MKTLLIGYDLNKTGQDYDNLIDAIKEMGAWWHYLDSTWLVRTEETHTTARNKLKLHLDSNDELLVVDVTGDAAAWTGFTESAGKWLKDNL